MKNDAEQQEMDVISLNNFKPDLQKISKNLTAILKF
jgi:hypothetical protein